MRMMIVGMGERSANRLFEMAEGLAAPQMIVPDWTHIEEAIASEPPDVLAAYIDRHPSLRLTAIQKLRALYPKVIVIALIDAESPSLVRLISTAGCADFVVLPDCPQDIRRALSALQTRTDTDVIEGEVVALIGAKGGVGTTTVACNLVDALAPHEDEKRRLILVDLNLYMGDVAVVVDVKPEPTTLYFLTRASATEDHALVDKPPAHRNGFRVLGLDGDLENADPVSAEQVVYLIERLRQRYDFVILDCGSAVNEVSMAACSVADRRLIVLTEQLAARLGARRRLEAIRALDPERTDVQGIVNRCHDRSRENLTRIERTIGVTLLDVLANDWQNVSDALERGQTIRENAPRSDLSMDFARLAHHFTGVENQETKRKKAFFDLFR
ncbi:MAG: AAA family ATPase [Myxococcota bacterium]